MDPPSFSLFEKTPPRPAPTLSYSWKERCPDAQLLYIQDAELANKELSILTPGAFGFDLEWKPNFVKGEGENPVALVQLANDETILLLQISAMKEFPTKLEEILGSSDFVKVGVAIQHDTQKLYKDHQVSTYNCVDLSLLARSIDNDRWKGKYNSSLGLARVIESYEYRLLGKGKISRSNWEGQLRDPQQLYAANDAHAGYTIYRRLIAMVNSSSTPPKSVWYTFDSVRGRLCQPSGEQWRAYNPIYDPGPPPPPRVSKEPKAADDEANNNSSGPSQLPDNNLENRLNERPFRVHGRAGRFVSSRPQAPDPSFRGPRNAENSASSNRQFSASVAPSHYGPLVPSPSPQVSSSTAPTTDSSQQSHSDHIGFRPRPRRGRGRGRGNPRININPTEGAKRSI